MFTKKWLLVLCPCRGEAGMPMCAHGGSSAKLDSWLNPRGIPLLSHYSKWSGREVWLRMTNGTDTIIPLPVLLTFTTSYRLVCAEYSLNKFSLSLTDCILDRYCSSPFMPCWRSYKVSRTLCMANPCKSSYSIFMVSTIVQDMSCRKSYGSYGAELLLLILFIVLIT